MKKTLLLIAAFLTFAATAIAQTVSTELAQTVATRFWNSYRPVDVKPATSVTALPFSELQHLHIFDVNNGEGFVIVSGDQRVRPILAYSFSTPASENLNPETGYWLNGYEAQIAEVAESDLQLQESSAMQQWGELTLSSGTKDPVGSLLDIPALMTTRWNQSNPYNTLCPYDSANHLRTVVGCVATAMAQIMRYWSYPAYGQGSHTYHSRLGEISADFESTSYLWHIMPNVCNEFSQEAQITATATISSHCGVAVDMMYGSSSGAYSECGPWSDRCAVSAFVDNFKYDSTIAFNRRDGIDDAVWLAILDSELVNRRPVYYHGSDSTGGHAFVLDGSDLEGRYHFNWGWGGSYDGFYTVDNLAPGSGGAGGNATYSFNQGQGIIYNIKPAFVEVFDTVDYQDSICENTQYVQFRDYNLLVYNVANRDTLLHHLDTVFRYHLKVIQKKKLYLNPNNGEEALMKTYCPADGYTFPECTFSKRNCMFTGWCRNREGNNIIYQPGETAYFNNSPTFYALWIDTTASQGIDDNEMAEVIRLWPNPTSGELYITLEMGHDAQVFVIDAAGRIVIRENYPNLMSGHTKISLQQLPAGNYTVQVKTEMGIYNRRIIKQ